MKEALAIGSLIVSIGSGIPYIIEVIQGKSKPERISWLLWAMLGLTYFVSALFENGAILFTLGEMLVPFIILALAIKYGVGGKSRFDIISLIIALVAFCLLFVVDEVLISLLLALCVDVIGAILTIRKLFLDPSSEPRLAWALAIVSSLLAIFALNSYTLETMLFPVYILLLAIIILIKSDPSKKIDKKIIEKL